MTSIARIPLAVAAALCAAVLAAADPAAERVAEPTRDGVWVWFGTYTGGSAKSEGIYVSRFDPATGGLSAPVLAGSASNPSFLALHPRLPVLYAVAEESQVDGRPMGAVVAFAIDEATGRLTPLNRQPSGGKGPCHLSVDRSGRAVLAANYGGGSVICLGIDDDGRLEPVVDHAPGGSPGGFIQHVGSGPNPRRQEGPHAHCILPSPDGRFAIACDLGLDKVLVHSLDVGAATLAARGEGDGRVPPGAGPRHFAFHPDGRHGYSINELDLAVTAFSYDPQAGSLAAFQTVSTLPENVTDRQGFSTAEIAVHPGGRFLYGSNRGHDSIAVFAIDPATGRLAFQGAKPAGVRTPRNFAIAPGGGFLLAAGQASGTVAVFAIDPTTGRLTSTGRPIDVPQPVCIRFRTSE